MVGIGAQELILLGILAVGVAAAVFIVLLVTRAASGGGGVGDRLAALEEDNRRLRQELDQLKGGPQIPPPMG
jgi:hypothetical protein